MLSAVITANHRHPALPLAGQPGHERVVRLGPLVLESGSLNSPTPTTDTDRTVSRRSEPSSCTTLTGEQPDPWDLLQPQDVISRHRGAKPRRRYELSGAISLLSPAYLYPLRDSSPTRGYRITTADFRRGSTCPSHRQAGFCRYTLEARVPSALSQPSRASVTLSEATAPVKLPACHGPK